MMRRDRAEVIQKLRHLTDQMDSFVDTVLEAIDEVPDLVCIWRGDKIYFANLAFRHLLGYKREEIVDHSWTEFLHPDDVDHTLDVVTQAMQDRKSIADLTNRWTTSRGKTVQVTWTATMPSPKGYSLALGVVDG